MSEGLWSAWSHALLRSRQPRVKILSASSNLIWDYPVSWAELSPLLITNGHDADAPRRHWLVRLHRGAAQQVQS